MPLAQLAPDYIRAISPYQPGKPIADLAREMGLDEDSILKLASNENPLGMSPKARAAVETAVGGLSLYPDGNGFDLKAKIAKQWGVDANRIVLGNGSNDVLELVARTFLTPADSAVYSEYAFAVYPLAVNGVGAQGIEVRASEYGHDLDAMLAAILPSTKVVFIANPNNPTGTLVRPGDLVEFLEKVSPKVLVVLDEAYYEYLDAANRPDTATWVRRFANLVVCRTFSKVFGMAGLRVGYAIAAPEVADLMNRVRQPFNVNSLAQIGAAAALDDWDFLRESIAVNRAGKQQLVDAFVRLEIPYIPSHGNFITFFTGDAAALNQFLLKNGVIVRPLASYKMPDCLRVTIGTAVQNARFIGLLEQAMQT